MFTFGSADAGRRYPSKDGNPKIVLMLDAQVATMIDVDHWVNPLSTSCDAYVLTDRGAHLIWVHPSKPTASEMSIGDEVHRKLNKAHYPMFFQSKAHGGLRTCAALTQAGLLVALEYNRMAIGAAQFLVEGRPSSLLPGEVPL